MLLIWRHPRVAGARGRCIGRSDPAVDRRRAKRLAHRVRALARREHLAREVWTSPQARCRAVGQWLRRWGFVHHVDADLRELDFGTWEGRAWTEIDPHEVATWEADFLHHAPGGGEPLAQLLQRVRRFADARSGPCLVIGHAGWINALRCLDAGVTPRAADWPAALPHGGLFRSPGTAAANRNTR
jgi:alpha-ribazole phosphatase